MVDQYGGSPQNRSSSNRERDASSKEWIPLPSAPDFDAIEPVVADKIDQVAQRLESIWARVMVSLGFITARSIYRRAVFLTARNYPFLAQLTVDEQGIDRTKLGAYYLDRVQGQVPPSQFVTGITELSRQVPQLLSEMISNRAAAHLFLQD